MCEFADGPIDAVANYTSLLHWLILGVRPFLGHFPCLQGDVLVIQVNLIMSSDPGLQSSTLRLNLSHYQRALHSPSFQDQHLYLCA